MDFSAKCPLNSQDELGSLSTTLNFLSDKLDSSISELKAANEKLKEDIGYAGSFPAGVGQFKLKVEDFSLTGLLNSISERYAGDLRRKGKNLDLSIPAYDLEVRADMFRIEQVLTNLSTMESSTVQRAGSSRFRPLIKAIP